MANEVYPFLLTMLGIGSLISFSSAGAAEATALVGVAASTLCKNRSARISSYISSSLGASNFLFTLIIVFLILSKLDMAHTISKGIDHLVVGLVFGMTSYISGKLLGLVGKRLLPVLAKQKKFMILYFVTLTICEFIAFIGFIMATLLLYTK